MNLQPENHPAYTYAGVLAYSSGLFGAMIFMEADLGPGWVGFFCVWIPMLFVMSWVASRAVAEDERCASLEETTE